MAVRKPLPPTLLPFSAALLGIASFSAMDAVMKALALGIGVFNAVFWRFAAAVMLSGIVYVATRAARPSPAAMRLHVIRGIVTTGMAIAFFWGLTRLPLAEAIALSFIAPILGLIFAALLLGERIRRTAILASVLGFAGVVVIVAGQNGGGTENRDLLGSAAVLGSAVLYAYNIVLMRQQALLAGPLEVTFYQNVTVTACLALFAPFFADLPPTASIPEIFSAAALASVSLLLLAWAYRRAEAQHLAPVEYSALVWAALFGYLYFDEEPAVSTLLGATLIVSGCLIAARSERRPPSPAEAAL